MRSSVVQVFLKKQGRKCGESQSLLYEVFCCSHWPHYSTTPKCRNPFFMRSSVVPLAQRVCDGYEVAIPSLWGLLLFRLGRLAWRISPCRNPFFMRSSVVPSYKSMVSQARKASRNPFFMRSSVVLQFGKGLSAREYKSQSLLYEVFCCSKDAVYYLHKQRSQSLLYEVFCCSMYRDTASLSICRNPFFMRSSVVQETAKKWVSLAESQSLLYEVFCCSKHAERKRSCSKGRNPFFMRSSVVPVKGGSWRAETGRNPFFMRSSVVQP